MNGMGDGYIEGDGLEGMVGDGYVEWLTIVYLDWNLR